ncbi:Scr1 family TA system antitoxin-like transcriptional regulator [Streptomyces sp. NPDC088194]|uniref:Scr1 family TA system antitoxin-like transcriptional regulator n=1 Tax=Streptomyces sp. NPDC088194 TaxID=3154931 RepID=UPI00344F7809
MTDPRPARVPGPRSLRALAEGCDAHARPAAPDPYGPRDAYDRFGPHTTRPRPEPSPLPPGRPAPAQPPVGAVVFGLALQSLRRGSASGANPVRGRADAARSIGAGTRAITRLEGALGGHGIGPDARHALLARYGMTDPETRDATARLLHAPDPAALHDSGAGWPQRLAACVGRAGRVRTYALTVFPRVLWTAGYAHALCTAHRMPPGRFTPPARVPEGVPITALLDEMVLCHLWNVDLDPAVTAAQLDHVLGLVAGGTLTVRVIGMHAQPTGAAMITELARAGGRHHLFAEEYDDFSGVHYRTAPSPGPYPGLLDTAESRAMSPTDSLAVLKAARRHATPSPSGGR